MENRGEKGTTNCVNTWPIREQLTVFICGELLLNVAMFYCCSWLLHDPFMKVRSSYQSYMDAVENYFNQLLPLVVDLQVIRRFMTMTFILIFNIGCRPVSCILEFIILACIAHYRIENILLGFMHGKNPSTAV